MLVAMSCLSAAGLAQAELKPPGKKPAGVHPTYVADELLVKLTEAAGSQIEAALTEGRPANRTGLAWFDALAEQYTMTHITPLFRRIADPETLRQRYPERARRAPPGAQSPDLRYIYKLTFQPNTDLRAAMRAFARESDVVYAEPNYIATTQTSD